MKLSADTEVTDSGRASNDPFPDNCGLQKSSENVGMDRPLLWKTCSYLRSSKFPIFLGLVDQRSTNCCTRAS